MTGVAVTTRERTVLDCARRLPRLEAVAAVDQLLSLGADTDQVDGLVSSLTGHSHARRVRSVLDGADPQAASAMESWCRCLVRDAEPPHPHSQVPLLLPDGRRAFLDLGFPRYRLALEYDGREHHTRPADQSHDKRRRAQFRDLGWEVLVVTSANVVESPDQVLSALLLRLQRRGWAPHPARLRRIQRRINYMAMCRRRDREHWYESY
ncbi:DUF559 domain-containing protein [Thermobifida halotolerans]|uniref:DUF559 domain-containing protein n=1 Tax=Thermobifida halotolerans TaxID=483545 RepID=A0AA97M4B3_9ACTN|nr:DUF559 domain-containing protein [Thermobifida halotolerans]UOE20018.1 DUF559 domain-containing protein [Thermobifida halotolerans]